MIVIGYDAIIKKYFASKNGCVTRDIIFIAINLITILKEDSYVLIMMMITILKEDSFVLIMMMMITIIIHPSMHGIMY